MSLAALGGWPAAKLAQLLLRLRITPRQFRSLLNLVALPLVVISGLVVYQTVDLWAVEARVMSYVGEVTGTGPGGAASRDAPDGKVSAARANTLWPEIGWQSRQDDQSPHQGVRCVIRAGLTALQQAKWRRAAQDRG